MKSISARSRRIIALLATAVIVFGLVSTILTAVSKPAGAIQLVDLNQWANKPPADWQNGNLNSSNSNYSEGDGVPFEALFSGLSSSSSHSIHINYDFSDNGKYGYDTLATYNISDTPTLPAGTPQTVAFPSDPIFPINSYNPETALGTRLLTVYGAKAGSVSIDTPTHNGDNADMVVHFTPLTSSTTVYLLWAGHLAIGTGGWGSGKGSSSYPGSSLHMRTQYLDGSGSRNQDRSIQTSAICVVTSPNLVLTKIADATPVVAGNVIGFTISISNNGNATATNVALTDVLPTNPGLTWTVDNVAGTGGFATLPTCTVTAGALDCTTVANLYSGKGFTVHLTSPTTAATAGDGGTVLNTVNATSTNATSPPPASATIYVTPAPVANLVLTKIADTTPVTAGDPVGFTISISNNGEAAATAVALTDTLPANDGLAWTVENVTGTGGFTTLPTCAVTAGALDCTTVASLPSGNGFTIHITSPTTAATAAGGGTITNTVNATSTNTPSPDPATATIEVGRAPVPNLTLTKIADAPTVQAGNPIGFTVALINNGDNAATAVALSDPLPSNPGLNWTVESVIGTGGLANPPTCSVTNGLLDCSSLASLPPGKGFTVHLTSPTTATTATNGGNVVNTVNATSSNAASPDPATASVIVTKAPTPNLVLTKLADVTPVVAGHAIGFTVSLTNNGDGAATSVMLSDILPSNSGLAWSVENVAGTGGLANPPSCSVANGLLDCSSLASLPPGTGFTVHLVSPTTSASGTSVDNTVNATSLNASSPPPASATITLTKAPVPNLVLTKLADAPTVQAGNPIGFTIALLNNGDAPATGVLVADGLPESAGVAWSVDKVAGTGGFADAPTCSVANAALSCSTVASLPPGNGFTIHLTSSTTDASGGTIANTATVTSTNAPNPPPATASIEINRFITPIVTLTKVADASRVLAGNKIGFLINVANTGGSPATNVLVRDILPLNAGLNWTVASVVGTGGFTSPPTCSISHGSLDCATVASLPGNGAGFEIHLTSQTVAATATSSQGKVLNVSAVAVENVTPPPEATATITVVSTPALLPAEGGVTPTTPEVSPLLPFTGGNQALGIILGLIIMVIGAALLFATSDWSKVVGRFRKREE